MSAPLAVLDGLMLDGLVAQLYEADKLAEASTHRLAGMTVRRAALRHPCRGAHCLHRNHRRDVMHCSWLMDVLNLPGDVAKPDDYGKPLVWGSFSREEATLLH